MVNTGKGKPQFDFLLTSDEISELPTVNVPEGSTAFAVDTKKAYIFYNGSWYQL